MITAFGTAFGLGVLAGIIISSSLVWIYGEWTVAKEPMVKDCEHGYHEWGRWHGDCMYQDRSCGKCGLMVTREIKNE